MTITERLGYTLGTLLSLVLIAGSLLHRLPLDITEVLGFVSGAWGVWLTVKENVWNWPIGIANSAFFLVLFVQGRLFADSGLQVVYIVLGALGWYWWLHGSAHKTALPIARTGPRHGAILAATIVVATVVLTAGLARVHGATPFWDALTTALSLGAQYLLTRKLIENWLLWISADVIYVALYAYKGFYLTSILYAIFLAMCVAGLVQWWASLRVTRGMAAGMRADKPGAAVPELEARHA